MMSVCLELVTVNLFLSTRPSVQALSGSFNNTKLQSSNVDSARKAPTWGRLA